MENSELKNKSKQIKNTAWLIFILGRHFILNTIEDMIVNAFLLISCVNYILINIINIKDIHVDHTKIGVKLCEIIGANYDSWMKNDTFNLLTI